MEDIEMQVDQSVKEVQREVEEMSQPCDTIYVGNIPWKVNEYRLGKFFEQFCEVYSARIIRDKGTARSRGFGFIDIELGKEEAVITAANEKEFEGRVMTVRSANPKKEKTDEIQEVQSTPEVQEIQEVQEG